VLRSLEQFVEVLSNFAEQLKGKNDTCHQCFLNVSGFFFLLVFFNFDQFFITCIDIFWVIFFFKYIFLYK